MTRAEMIEKALRAWLAWSEEPAGNWPAEQWGRVFAMQQEAIRALSAPAAPKEEA